MKEGGCAQAGKLSRSPSADPHYLEIAEEHGLPALEDKQQRPAFLLAPGDDTLTALPRRTYAGCHAAYNGMKPVISNLRPRSSWIGLLLLALVFLLPSSVEAAELSEAQENVIKANEAFYSAFRNRDMEAMDAIWARNDEVAVIHPGWPGISGRERIATIDALEMPLGNLDEIASDDPRLQVRQRHTWPVLVMGELPRAQSVNACLSG
jgi:hypothetical protein